MFTLSLHMESTTSIHEYNSLFWTKVEMVHRCKVYLFVSLILQLQFRYIISNWHDQNSSHRYGIQGFM